MVRAQTGLMLGMTLPDRRSKVSECSINFAAAGVTPAALSRPDRRAAYALLSSSLRKASI